MIEKRVLGKGLDALIPKKIISDENKEFTYLAIDKILVGTYQPRKNMDPKELADLAQSIKEKGFLQPLVVRPLTTGNYEVVAGGRRLQAAKVLGLSEVPVMIKNLDNKNTLVCAIMENLQRQDLNPIEEAEAFKRLMDEFEFLLDDIAKFVGKDKTTIANALRLLKLPEVIQQALQQGILSRSQARTILAVETLEQQTQLFHDILAGGMTVRQIEEKVSKPGSKKKNNDPFCGEVENKLQKLLGTKVRILNKKNNRGKIIIEYYNLNDLERVIKRIEN